MVIRELIHAGEPLSHSELIERTSLSRQGVYDIIGRMAENGTIAYTGTGQRQLIELRNDHPLYEELVRLYQAESKQFDSLVSALHSEISTLDPQPDSAWIFGKAARGVDEYGDPLQVALLGKPKTIDRITRTFREQLIRRNIEPVYDVTIDPRGFTLADLESRPSLIEQGTILLWGADPASLLDLQSDQASRISSHKELDETARIESKLWAELLKRYPEIIPRTVNWLNRQLEHSGTGQKMEWMEWKNILEKSSYQRLRKFLESESERSVRLRQSLPFWMVLTDHEREKFNQMKSNLNAP
jgi:hypothetical protein